MTRWLAAQKYEDAGENRDNSGNNANGESKNCNQAVKDEKNREQKHSDVSCEGHELEHGARSTERRARSYNVR